MKKLLENLWYEYFQSESKSSEQEKAAIRELALSEQKLLLTLSDEKKAALAEYENCFDNLFDISVKEAFLCGVSFATKYLLEALEI